jgi:hypothetical protein
MPDCLIHSPHLSLPSSSPSSLLLSYPSLYTIPLPFALPLLPTQHPTVQSLAKFLTETAPPPPPRRSNSSLSLNGGIKRLSSSSSSSASSLRHDSRKEGVRDASEIARLKEQYFSKPPFGLIIAAKYHKYCKSIILF